ncbi:MAG: GNAT family N-acetyltransferase [Anaerolineae bacterium]|jgi:ribosomal protein S18 acetylase RimI-like enzyme
MPITTIVRAFDGSLADARGLLALEKETFDESPYSPREVQAMLTAGPQRAWVAIEPGLAPENGERIVGFCIAFLTRGLHATCWEIDLLAVHPRWTRQGLATRLIRAAAAYGARLARRARAVVATDNAASARAFARAGFHPAETCQMLIYRPQDTPPTPAAISGVKVRPTINRAELDAWLPADFTSAGRRPPLEPAPHSPAACSATWLLAEQDGQPAGYAERIEVQTLLYRGLWIESLAAPGEQTRAALVRAAMQQAAAAGLDEVGAMVPAHNVELGPTLLAAGFRSLGAFRWLQARLPLPGWAQPAGDRPHG